MATTSRPARLGIILLLFATGVARAASSNGLDVQSLAYNLHTTAEAYDKVGIKSPKWDEPFKQCLTNYARIRASTNGGTGELQADLSKRLTRLKQDQCNDPLFRYLYARFVTARTSTVSAEQNAQEIAEVSEVMEKSSYPEIRKMYADFWAYKAASEPGSGRTDATNYLARATAHLAKALNESDLPLLEAEQGCDLLMSSPWWSEGTRWDMYRQFEPALTNRWKGNSFALLARGRGYLSYGWLARGIGYAPTVTSNGWQQLAARLSVAAEALEKAWDINPSDTRICDEMMRVELGQGQGRDRLDKWFERGIKLEPNNTALCYDKLEYLRPRWYGSIQEMVEFGRACTMNTNYTGGARLMLANAYYEASREIHDKTERAAFWQKTNVWADVRFTFDQFFKLYPNAVGYRHNYALFAVRCEQWQDFLNQAKLFPSTNYSYFGGIGRFNRIVQYAEEKTQGKKP